MHAPIVLGGYPAKKCPRRTHNNFSPNSPPRPEVDASAQIMFDAGISFEQQVTKLLLEELGERAVLIGESTYDEEIEATLAAITAGAEVVVNGRLPNIGSRSGAPDVLVRFADGYFPVDIKNHGTAKSAAKSSVEVTSLSDPVEWLTIEGLGPSGHVTGDDAMQLAHYTRMLQDLGLHPSEDVLDPDWLVGGIIGTTSFSDDDASSLMIVWFNLGLPSTTTYSASDPKHRKVRSMIDRYDHEFAFRLKVADAAKRGQELVRPIGVAECGRCEWIDHCREVAGTDDASFAITLPQLDAREWLFVRQRGGATIAELAELDADTLVADYTAHAVGRQTPPKRLRSVVEQARMIRDGVAIETLGAPPEIPTADLEIDFDIEWDREQRIYQWGLRARHDGDEGTAAFHSRVSFEPLDDAAEHALACEFIATLSRLVDEATAAGRSVAIYYWSHIERSRTTRWPELTALLDSYGVDLRSWMTKNYRAVGGFSLKNIAPMFGFQWSVDDPGGLASMDYIDLARTPGPDGAAAREWCEQYNASDVTAQSAIRDGLRSLDPTVKGRHTR